MSLGWPISSSSTTPTARYSRVSDVPDIASGLSSSKGNVLRRATRSFQSGREAVVRDSYAVIDEAKAAGVYVFGGGIDENVPPVLVSADGTVAEGGYPWAPSLNGDFTVLELPSRDEAVAWAARLAKACRCDQELRVFGFDPQC